MSIDLLLTISAIFSAIGGLVALFSPTVFIGGGVVPTPALIDIFRGFGGLFVAVAVLNWMARGTPPSRARNAIILSNTIGFLFATVFTGLAVLHGYPVWVWALVGVSALLTIGYFVAAMRGAPTEQALAPVAPARVADSMPTALPARERAESTPVKTPARKASKKTARKASRKSARKTSKRV